MKIIINKQNLSEVLGLAGKAINRKSNLPVLANVLIEADEAIRFAATDLEFGISATVEGVIETPGKITVEHKMFSALVNTLDGDVTLELDNALKVSAGSSSAELPVISADEFPPMRIDGGNKVFDLDCALLKSIVLQVTHAASTEKARPVLTAVSVLGQDSKLQFAAADGFRLAVQKTYLETPITESFELLIPAKAFANTVNVLEPGNVEIRQNRGLALFKTPGVTTLINMIKGQYPDYGQIIPTTFTTKIVVDTPKLLHACKQTGIFSDWVDLEPGEMTLKISGFGEETGKMETEIEAKCAGEFYPIRVNAKFLQDTLTALRYPKTVIELKGETDPVVITPEEGNFLGVIMPMVRLK